MAREGFGVCALGSGRTRASWYRIFRWCRGRQDRGERVRTQRRGNCGGLGPCGPGTERQVVLADKLLTWSGVLGRAEESLPMNEREDRSALLACCRFGAVMVGRGLVS